MSKLEQIVSRVLDTHPCAVCGEADRRCLQICRVDDHLRKMQPSLLTSASEALVVKSLGHHYTVVCFNCRAKMQGDRAAIKALPRIYGALAVV